MQICSTPVLATIDPQGYLSSARCHLSPNRDKRPEKIDISLLVIHNISLPPGEFGGNWIDALFCNSLSANDHPYFSEISHLQVSAHLLIRRDGELVQYVPFSERAWHAGVSEFKGVSRCNDFSIGIELEGDDVTPYSEAQYQQLLEVVPQIMRHYPAITIDHILGHQDIAPGRKSDPGPLFDWQRLQRELQQRVSS